MNALPTTPLARRIAARRSAQPLDHVGSTAPTATDAGPSRAPLPEWRRRSAERVAELGHVAVLDTTGLA